MNKNGSSHYGACLIEHCPNERRKLSPVCRSCAACFGYWERRGAGAILARQNQLEKWQDRIQYLSQERPNPRSIRNASRFISRRRS